MDYRLHVSSVSDAYAKNQVRCDVEGRFGVSVNQPGAVVKVATRLRASRRRAVRLLSGSPAGPLSLDDHGP